MFFRYMPALLIVVSLAACQVYRSEIPADPAASIPAAFSGGNRSGAIVEKPFWQYFEDPVLERLEKEALAANPSLAQAVARHEQAVALARLSASALFPYLNLNGRISRDRQISTFGTSTGTSMNLSLAAGYEIDLWQRLASSREGAAFSEEAAAMDLAAARISIAAQVADLYFLILEQKGQLVLSDEMISSYEDSLERVRQRYEAGLVPALDLYQARQNILAVRVRKPGFEATAANSIHALAALLGRFPEDFSLGIQTGLPEVEKLFQAGLPANLISRRPDIRAAWLRLMAADRQTAAAVAARFPSFNILAEIGRGRLDFGTAISDTFWSLALQGLQPLFDAGRRKAEVAARRAAAREALAGYRQTVLNGFREVEDSLTLLATTGRRLDALAAREKTAAETLSLAEDRYFQGLSDYLPVLGAQQQYFEVKSELLAAQRQMLSANISLARAAYQMPEERRQETGDRR